KPAYKKLHRSTTTKTQTGTLHRQKATQQYRQNTDNTATQQYRQNTAQHEEYTETTQHRHRHTTQTYIYTNAHTHRDLELDLTTAKTHIPRIAHIELDPTKPGKPEFNTKLIRIGCDVTDTHIASGLKLSPSE